MNRDERRTAGGEGLAGMLTSPRLGIGIAAVVVGILVLGDNLGWFDMEPLVEWWPAALILLGAQKLLTGAVGWGVILMTGGGWLLLNNLALLRVDFWDAAVPLALVAFGVLLVSRSLGWHWRSTQEKSSSDAVVHANALLGGLQRTVRSTSFRGGDALAVMGGCEIDLRAARLAPEGAVLDVVAFWGGVEIWVPEDWEVDCQVMPIMAGVEERLAGRANDGVVGAPRLKVRGVAIMGGVEIANGPAKPTR